MSKRPYPAEGGQDSGREKKAVKVHPFFTRAFAKPGESSTTGTASQSLVWQPSLGPKKTCLHATNLSPKAARRVAIFDLDGTLIKFDTKAKSASTEWAWWHSLVPAKLKKLHDEGYAIVIVSNQAIKAGRIPAWKEKVQHVGMELKEVPFHLFAATERDGYRKPMIGMWTELTKIYLAEGIEVDKASSFFFGDAAGRKFQGKSSGDFAATDRKWALNIGVEFHTPEEYFLGQVKHTNWVLEGFQVSSLPELPLFLPASTPLVPPRSDNGDIVLFVGYPSLGKTTFYKRYFEPEGFEHVNQDTLGSRGKCQKKVEEILDMKGRCVVLKILNFVP